MIQHNLKVTWQNEGELIPEGCSLTKTSMAYYIRIREGNIIYHIRCAYDINGDFYNTEAIKTVNEL